MRILYNPNIICCSPVRYCPVTVYINSVRW